MSPPIRGAVTAAGSAIGSRLGVLLAEQAHDCPERLPAHSRGAPRTAYTRGRPELVVEVSADLALDGLRWRHPVRLVLRHDLRPVDLLDARGRGEDGEGAAISAC